MTHAYFTGWRPDANYSAPMSLRYVRDEPVEIVDILHGSTIHHDGVEITTPDRFIVRAADGVEWTCSALLVMEAGAPEGPPPRAKAKEE